MLALRRAFTTLRLYAAKSSSRGLEKVMPSYRLDCFVRRFRSVRKYATGLMRSLLFAAGTLPPTVVQDSVDTVLGILVRDCVVVAVGGAAEYVGVNFIGFGPLPTTTPAAAAATILLGVGVGAVTTGAARDPSIGRGLFRETSGCAGSITGVAVIAVLVVIVLFDIMASLPSRANTTASVSDTDITCNGWFIAELVDVVADVLVASLSDSLFLVIDAVFVIILTATSFFGLLLRSLIHRLVLSFTLVLLSTFVVFLCVRFRWLLLLLR